MQSVTLIPGPAEEALASVIRSSSLPALPDAAHAARACVEPCVVPKMGDCVVDVRFLVDQAERARADLCSGVASVLSGLPGVERAVAVPPRAFLRLGTDFLRTHVVDGILRSPESFGGTDDGSGRVALVVFSTPNANKPLHVGHLRNNLLGASVGNLLEAHGYAVRRASVLSDWGIHMCQAAAAYRRWGERDTPERSRMKPDHFVGKYYRLFHEAAVPEGDRSGDDADPVAPSDEWPAARSAIGEEAQRLLEGLERGDPDGRGIVRDLADWVDSGIRETYHRIGSRFDFIFREAETLEFGKQLVAEALESGRCRARADGSVYVDLSDVDLGEVTLLRRDGTAVVYTHMLANNVHRYRQAPFDLAVSLYGEQWKTGTNVMREVLRRLGHEWADRLERCYYGMVSLPEGKMRSRSGSVVTADELLDHVRDRLLGEWIRPALGAGDSADRAADELAIGLVKHYLLSTDRLQPIVFDEEDLWRRGLPRFLRLMRALAAVEEAGSEPDRAPVPGPAPERAELRSLLLDLNSFPRICHAAFREREPALLVRHLERLSPNALAWHRWARDDVDLGRALRAVMHRCLELLNIELSVDELRLLPPPPKSLWSETR